MVSWLLVFAHLGQRLKFKGLGFVFFDIGVPHVFVGK